MRKNTRVHSVNLYHDNRAAPHELYTGLVITIWNHMVSFTTDRNTVFINSNCIRERLRMPGFGIQVNKSTDTVLFEELVGWVVIHGRIKAHVFDMKAWKMFAKFMESNEEI